MFQKLCYLAYLIFFLSSGTLTARAASRVFLGAPERLGISGVTSSTRDRSPSISSDGMTISFHSNRPGDRGADDDLWVASRESLLSPWEPPQSVAAPVNDADRDEQWPDISTDGNTIYFSNNSVYSSSTRANSSDPWRSPVVLGADWPTGASPNISEDDLTLYFSSGFDIWSSSRADVSDPWPTPQKIAGAVNTEFVDVHPSITTDNNHLFFMSNRAPVNRNWDVWMATRDRVGEFGSPISLGDLFPAGFTSIFDPDISADGSTLYFASRGLSVENPIELWQASIEIIDPVIYADGDVHVINTDMTPQFIHVFDGPSNAPTTVRIEGDASIATDGLGSSFEVFDSSIGEVHGGNIERDIDAHNSAIVRIFGGEVGDDVDAGDHSQVMIHAGTIGGDVEASSEGRVSIFGGNIFDDVQATDHGRIQVFGGFLGEDIEVNDNGQISIHGGIIGPDNVSDEQIQAFGDGLISLHGTNFSIDGSAVALGAISQLEGVISGTLADGNAFDMAFIQEDAGQIVLNAPVPEPSTGLLMMLNTLAFVCVSKRSVDRSGRVDS